MDKENALRSDQEKLVKMKLPSLALQLGQLDRSLGSRKPVENTSPRMDHEDSRSTVSSSSRTSSQYSMTDMIDRINLSRVGEGRMRRSQEEEQGTVCLVEQDSGRIKWIQPSGPRKPGEGTEDAEQGIVSAEATPTGGALLRMTLLASGFVIGPAGQSVRDICKRTTADIKSWTDTTLGSSSQPTRMYVIEGRPRAVGLALSIIHDAVNRYKELCEGGFCGESVSRIQIIRGLEFSYQPPPRNVVPYAAALKGQASSRMRLSTVRNMASPRREPEAVLYASQILDSVRNCRVAAASSYNSRIASQQQPLQLQQRHHSPLYARTRQPRNAALPKHALPLNARSIASYHKALAGRNRLAFEDLPDDQEQDHGSPGSDADYPPGYGGHVTQQQPHLQWHSMPTRADHVAGYPQEQPALAHDHATYPPPGYAYPRSAGQQQLYDAPYAMQQPMAFPAPEYHTQAFYEGEPLSPDATSRFHPSAARPHRRRHAHAPPSPPPPAYFHDYPPPPHAGHASPTNGFLAYEAADYGAASQPPAPARRQRSTRSSGPQPVVQGQPPGRQSFAGYPGSQAPLAGQDEVGHSSSQWHVGYESPPQGRSEHGKAPPPTPPLAFKHSPDRFGTWRIRRENPSCTASPQREPRLQRLHGSPSPQKSLAPPNSKATAASLLSEGYPSSDFDNSPTISTNTAGGTSTAPAWVCGSHPLFPSIK